VKARCHRPPLVGASREGELHPQHNRPAGSALAGAPDVPGSRRRRRQPGPPRGPRADGGPSGGRPRGPGAVLLTAAFVADNGTAGPPRAGSTPRWTPAGCRPASASWSASLAPTWRLARSWSSTRRRATSIRPPSRRRGGLPPASRHTTLVVVTHRLSSARRADRVLLMDGPNIAVGAHDDLV